MQILHGIHHTEAGTCVQVERCMADRREVDENSLTVILLQGHGGVDGKCGGTTPALCIDDGEYPRLASAARFAACRGVAREGLEQAVRTGHTVDELARAGAHGAHNCD